MPCNEAPFAITQSIGMVNILDPSSFVFLFLASYWKEQITYALSRLSTAIETPLFFFFFSISLSRRKLHKNNTEFVPLKNWRNLCSQRSGKLWVYNLAENIATPLPRFICTRNILIGKARTRNHAIERVSLHSLAVNANLPNNLEEEEKAHYTWFKTTLVSDPWK
jgi:hypothetical protein